ncbi:hypothetical protein F4604DRAFT_1916001 [Suillus subluteus]|nr:hypothetical protein F4604DRAFT_1916001 [Suillus subluteus]
MDGVKYSVGDAVVVLPGEDEDTIHASSYKCQPSQSINKLANDHWFCLIQYFFEDDEGVKKFHAQWFTHSSKTLLQEVGHSHALYLMLSNCSDVEVEAISQKCNVHELAKDSFQPDESTLEEDNNFHFGYATSYSSASCYYAKYNHPDLRSTVSTPVSFSSQT